MNEVYSSNGEQFENDFETVLDDITGYNCSTYEEALEAIIYVGEPITPTIDVDWIVDTIEQRVGEELYEQVGEFSDCWIMTERNELRDYLKFWVARQNFSCYSVKNIKEISILEYITEDELKEIYN